MGLDMLNSTIFRGALGQLVVRRHEEELALGFACFFAVLNF